MFKYTYFLLIIWPSFTLKHDWGYVIITLHINYFFYQAHIPEIEILMWMDFETM